MSAIALCLCSSTISETVPVRYQIAGTARRRDFGQRRGRACARARLAAGRGLPPVRGLAAELGVSPATVAARLPGAAPAGPGRDRRPQRHPGAAPPAGRRPAAPPARRPRPAPRDLSPGEPDPRLLPPLGPHLRRLAAAAGRAGRLRRVRAAGPSWSTLARRGCAADGVPGRRTLTVTVRRARRASSGCSRAHLRPGDRVGGRGSRAGPTCIDLVAALGPARRSPCRSTTRARRWTGCAAALARRARPRSSSPAGRRTRPAPPSPPARAARAAAAARRPARPAGHRGRPRGRAGPRAAAPAGRGDRDVGVRPLGVQAVRAGPAARGAGRRRGDGRPGRGPAAARRRLGLHRAAAAGRWSCGATRRSPPLVDRAARTSTSGAGTACWPRWPTGAWPRTAAPASTSGCRSPDETVAVAALRDAGWAVAPGALYRIATPPAVRITVSSLDDADLAALADAVAAAVRPTDPIGFTA